MPTPDKATIRRICLTKRAALSDQTKQKASAALCARIESLTVYQNAEKIALYQAVGGEIDLHPLWLKACAAGKTCYLPVVRPNDNTLIFLPAGPKTPLKRNQFHILEPDIPHSDAILLEALDLMLMPLVAFDTQGTRLGRGAGFYDKTLQNKSPPAYSAPLMSFNTTPYS